MKATEILNNVKELLSISKEVSTELSKQEEVEYLLQRIKDILTNG